MHLQPEESIYYISLQLDAFITAFKVETKGAILGKKQLGFANPHCIDEGCFPSRDYISVTLTLIWRKHTRGVALVSLIFLHSNLSSKGT